MKPLTKQVVEIVHPEKGLFAFVPVTFDEEHYSAANIVVHSAVLDYKFRAVPLAFSEKEDVIMIINSVTKDNNNSKKMAHAVPEFPKTFEATLFPKGISIAKLDITYLGKLYDDFVQSLITAHENLKERITGLRKRFQTETAKLGPVLTVLIAVSSFFFAQENIASQAKNRTKYQKWTPKWPQPSQVETRKAKYRKR